MIRIELDPHRAVEGQNGFMEMLENGDYHSFRRRNGYNVRIHINEVTINNTEAYAPDIAGELIQLLIELAKRESRGYISFGDESFFFFQHFNDMVEIFHYSPDDISDANYRNEIGAVSRQELVDAILNALLELKRQQSAYRDEFNQGDYPSQFSAIRFIATSPSYGP